MKYIEIFKSEFMNQIDMKEDFKFVSLNEDHYIGVDKEGHIVFAVESSEGEKEPYILRTKKLNFEINVSLLIDFNGDQQKRKVFLIRCNSNENREKNMFLDLCETLFGNGKISEDYFVELVKTLSDFFSKKIEISDKELQGLYAELLTIEFFLSNINLGIYWQKGDREKFDFSFNEKLKVEVKSTTQTERKHHFKHDQLTSELFDIYIVSFLLRNDDAGYSLYDLIMKSLSHLEGNQYQLLRLKKIIHDIEENRLKEMKFSCEYSKDKMRIFRASVVPRFIEKDHEGVINAEYDSILEGIESIQKDELISLIRSQEREDHV